MPSGFWIDPLVFLVDTVVSLYVFALLLRFVLQLVRADFRNPVSQTLISITHPPLRLLRRFLPSIGRIDTASLVLMLVLQSLGGYLIFLLKGADMALPALVVWALGQVLELTLNIFFFAIIIRALSSWVGGGLAYGPAISLVYSLTDPLLRPAQRWMPIGGGIDLSPMVPLIGIQLAKMLLIPPLQHLVAILNQSYY